MQELRSTDILEKEIQTDARKKAEEILKQAESECTNILESVDADLQKPKNRYFSPENLRRLKKIRKLLFLLKNSALQYRSFKVQFQSR